MATLIQAQGEMLDNIEANLEDANEYLEKAEDNLQKAKKWHEKTRTVKHFNLINFEFRKCAAS